jgi:aerobic carbon-monoxide dehydrogenase large subunit
MTGESPIGIELCTYVERSGAGEEFGAVEACPDGTFLALSGCCSTGQGHETSFPHVVAAVLDVDVDWVRLIERDTAVIIPRGIGSFASRSMQIGGTALHRAAGKLIDAARQPMAEACAVPVADVRYSTGELIAGDRTITPADLAAAGQMRADETVAPPAAFPFGAYAAVVEVDTELGKITLLKLVASTTTAP